MGSDGDRQLSTPTVAAPARGPLHRAGLVVCSAAVAAAMLFSPVKLCLMAVALRIPCPGCGMTRATLALLHGNVERAFALHPLSPIIVPLATGLVAAQATRYVRTGAVLAAGRLTRTIELTLAALAFLLVAIWAARFFGYFGGPVSVR